MWVMPKRERKNPHAVALGKLGGPKGGKARAASMTPEERKVAGRYAANVRWRRVREERARYKAEAPR